MDKDALRLTAKSLLNEIVDDKQPQHSVILKATTQLVKKAGNDCCRKALTVLEDGNKAFEWSKHSDSNSSQEMRRLYNQVKRYINSSASAVLSIAERTCIMRMIISQLLAHELRSEPTPKFKPGDRIRCIQGTCPHRVNKTGTVRKLGETDNGIVFVDWDDEYRIVAFDYELELLMEPTHEEAVKQFQVGDTVKVLRKAVGWSNGWNADWNNFTMTSMVGRTYQIQAINHLYGVSLKHHDEGRSYWFPAFVLEKVGDTARKFKKGDRIKKIAGKYGIGTTATVECYRTFGAELDGKEFNLQLRSDVRWQNQDGNWVNASSIAVGCEDDWELLEEPTFVAGDWVVPLDDANWQFWAKDKAKAVGCVAQILSTDIESGLAVLRIPSPKKGVFTPFAFRTAKLRHATDEEIARATFTVITPQPQKDTTMALSPIKIEQKTFVTLAGLGTNDASVLSTDQMFEAIGQAEKEIERLSALKAQPKALKKRIADLQSGIDGLVVLLDEREDEKKSKK